jgi:hypothetical protein
LIAARIAVAIEIGHLHRERWNEEAVAERDQRERRKQERLERLLVLPSQRSAMMPPKNGLKNAHAAYVPKMIDASACGNPSR